MIVSNQLVRREWLIKKTNGWHTEFALNDVVAGQRNAASADLGVSSLVNEVSHALQVGVAPGDVGFTNSEHVHGGLI